MNRRVPRDLARDQLRPVIDHLRALAADPAQRRGISSEAALLLAADTLSAIAEGVAPPIDGRLQNFPRWQAVHAVLNAASESANITDAFERAGESLQCDARTVRGHWNADVAERKECGLPQFLLTFRD